MAWVDSFEPYVVYRTWDLGSVVGGRVVGLLRLLVVCPRFVQFLRVVGGEIAECDLLFDEERLKDILVPDDAHYFEQHCGSDNSNDELTDKHLSTIV